MNPLYVIIGILVVAIVLVIGIYNGLVRTLIRVKEAWSDIEIQLKRRYNLIPNLVETVKGYASHEQETLDRVIQARNSAMGAQGQAEKGQAENMLTGALKSIFALSEAYPDLKANQNFAKLQDELTDTENKIQAARRFYNGMVRDFNTKLQVFPNNMIVGFFGGKFQRQEFFEVENEEEKKNVEVKF
ncbi:LemA family protein [Candidatus Peribacteria bacterium]|jgi:LemA protein|nr:LemA family protein [Candidatus Peribacteria bacterium]MBT4021289.1 LemA family protein [Candidatus Peribacteria bacterium]MBT4240338.1 LemA family protein [Candidatus Peribacteria bacterium]MBT4474065.1 LemA family protein [Candidatus Peribacteria bacterium]